MSLREARAKVDVQLIPAIPDDEPVLSNLLELYIHEFSDFVEVELDSNGRFGYKHLPLYWLEDIRHPFLIKVEGKLAGFALVKQGSELSGDRSVWDIAEFFIARRFRRKGVGTAAAQLVWQRFPGHWEVRVMNANTKAVDFWSRAIMLFAGSEVAPATVVKNGSDWSVFSFRSDRL